MKTYVITLLLAVLLASPLLSFARCQIGMVGGLSMAKIQVEGLQTDFSYHRGFEIGGILDIVLSDYASIYLEPRYVQKGVRIHQTLPFYGRVDGDGMIDYIQIPVSLKIAYTESDIRPYLFVGPSFGFLLGSRFQGESDGQSIDADVGGITKGFDVGLGAGTGIGFAMGAFVVFSEIRYVVSYADVLADGTIVINGQEETVSGDFENRSFEVSAGIVLPLGD